MCENVGRDSVVDYQTSSWFNLVYSLWDTVNTNQPTFILVIVRVAPSALSHGNITQGAPFTHYYLLESIHHFKEVLGGGGSLGERWLSGSHALLLGMSSWNVPPFDLLISQVFAILRATCRCYFQRTLQIVCHKTFTVIFNKWRCIQLYSAVSDTHSLFVFFYSQDTTLT